MEVIIEYITSGLVLGLMAGLSPGPLTTLVITNTLRYNRGAGIRAACAPIFTDAPILLATLFLLTKLSNYHTILALISFAGAGFILYLAWDSLRISPHTLKPSSQAPQPYYQAIITNLLSPHPYLFWMLIGAPTTLKAASKHFLLAPLWIGIFYVALVGSKIVVALLTDQSKAVLNSKAYLYIIKALGLILIAFSIFLIKDGLIFLKTN